MTKEEAAEILKRVHSLVDLAIEADEAMENAAPHNNPNNYKWQDYFQASEMYEEAVHYAEIEFAALMAKL